MSPTDEADRHAAEIEAIKDDVLTAIGVIEPSVRRLVMDGGAPPGLAGYLDKVRNASYKLTEADIDSLKRSGLSEDAIFELTVAASVGAAYARIQLAKRAMRTGRWPSA